MLTLMCVLMNETIFCPFGFNLIHMYDIVRAPIMMTFQYLLKILAVRSRLIASSLMPWQNCISATSVNYTVINYLVYFHIQSVLESRSTKVYQYKKYGAFAYTVYIYMTWLLWLNIIVRIFLHLFFCFFWGNIMCFCFMHGI